MTRHDAHKRARSRPSQPLSSAAASGRWLCLAAIAALVVALLPGAATASTSGYSKTMLFKAKECQGRVRDLPNSARIDPVAGKSGANQGELIYGPKSNDYANDPPYLSFVCYDEPFSGVMLSWALYDPDTGNECWIPDHPPSAKDRKDFSGPCDDYGFTPVPGATNIDTFQSAVCGGAGGSGGSSSGCSAYSTAYVVTLHGAWIMLNIVQKSATPVQWIVRMLQRSTFRVDHGAGGDPYKPEVLDGSPCFAGDPVFGGGDLSWWTLPSSWTAFPV